MKRKDMSVSLLWGLLAFAGASALAGTIRVPDDYESVNDAVLAAGADDTVVVAAGDYPLSGTLRIEKGITLTGAGKDKTVLYRPATAPNFRILSITNAAATVGELTISNGVENAQDDLYAAYHKGTGGVFIGGGGGTLLNCRITKCASSQFYSQGGLVITVAGGLAEGCEIDHCSSTGNGSSGAGIYVERGEVSRCFVHDNESARTGCGIVASEYATVSHCTVVRNTTKSCKYVVGGINVEKSSATVRDCVMWGNLVYERKTESESFDFGGAGSCFVSCATPGVKISNANIRVDNPGFADSDNGDFTPLPGSPLVGAASDGGDIGAFSSGVTAFTVGFTASAKRIVRNGRLILSARLVNAPAEGEEAFSFAVTAPDKTVQAFDGATVELILDQLGDYQIAVTGSKGGVEATPVPVQTVSVVDESVNVATTEQLLEALALAEDGMTINLAEGDYDVTEPIWLSKGVRLIGDGRDKTTIRRPVSTPNEYKYNVLTLCHADCVVSGLTVSGGKINDEQANGVWIIGYGGTLADCTLTGNSCGEWNTVAGAACLYSSGGLITRCFITNNTCNGQSALAGGVYVRAGRLENSLIASNTGKNGAGVSMAKSGVVRNCTIVNNTASVKGGGIYVDCDQNTTRIENCIIDSNTCTGTGDTSKGKPNWTCNSPNYEAYFHTNATSFAVGVGTITDAPVYAEGWSLDAKSVALIDHGAPLVDIGELDVVGNTRVFGAGIDLGCYERNSTEIECGVVWKPQGVVSAGTAVTLEATGVDALSPTAWTWTVTKPSGASFQLGGKVSGFTADEIGPYAVILRVMTASGEQEFSEGLDGLTVFPKDVYVALDGANVAPYNSRANAATNIHDALQFAAMGTTVWIAEGEHAVTNEIFLSDSITLAGVGRKEAVLLRRTDAEQHRIVSLDHAGAVVSNMTITGGRVNNVGDDIRTAGGGAVVNAGSLVDCWIVANTNGAFYGVGCGLSLQGSAAKAVRCRIENNVFGGYAAGGVHMTAGEMDNCLVAGNLANSCGGVYVEGTGEGLIRNCTVVCNRAGNPPSNKDTACGLSLNNPAVTVVNCIVRGNDHTKYKPGAADADPDKYLVWSDFHVGDNDKVKAAQVQSCCLAVGFGSDCVTGDPCFRSDWHIRAKSPCHDKGLSTLNDWARGTVDLDGKPRLVGYGVDMGCFENQSGGLQVIVR